MLDEIEKKLPKTRSFLRASARQAGLGTILTPVMAAAGGGLSYILMGTAVLGMNGAETLMDFGAANVNPFNVDMEVYKELGRAWIAEAGENAERAAYYGAVGAGALSALYAVGATATMAGTGIVKLVTIPLKLVTQGLSLIASAFKGQPEAAMLKSIASSLTDIGNKQIFIADGKQVALGNNQDFEMLRKSAVHTQKIVEMDGLVYKQDYVQGVFQGLSIHQRDPNTGELSLINYSKARSNENTHSVVGVVQQQAAEAVESEPAEITAEVEGSIDVYEPSDVIEDEWWEDEEIVIENPDAAQVANEAEPIAVNDPEMPSEDAEVEEEAPVEAIGIKSGFDNSLFTMKKTEENQMTP